MEIAIDFVSILSEVTRTVIFNCRAIYGGGVSVFLVIALNSSMIGR